MCRCSAYLGDRVYHKHSYEVEHERSIARQYDHETRAYPGLYRNISVRIGLHDYNIYLRDINDYNNTGLHDDLYEWIDRISRCHPKRLREKAIRKRSDYPWHSSIYILRRYN